MMMCDAPPAMGDDGRQLVLETTELERVIPLAGARVVRLGGDQVTAIAFRIAAEVFCITRVSHPGYVFDPLPDQPQFL
jgi:hypothetical protein